MNLQCLKDAIGDTDAQELVKLANSFPSEATKLLQLIAAALVSGNNAITEQTIISDQWIAGITNVASTALTIPDGAKGALVTPYDNDLYFVLDGGDAHTGQAHYLQEKATLDVNSLAGFKMAAADSSSAATVYVTYYK